jgi:hypothetical protein
VQLLEAFRPRIEHMARAIATVYGRVTGLAVRALRARLGADGLGCRLLFYDHMLPQCQSPEGTCEYRGVTSFSAVSAKAMMVKRVKRKA